jgi:hypothetical protein
MSKLVLYQGLVTDLGAVRFDRTIEGVVTECSIQTIGLWRNQLERENIEKPFLYPAVFIEFLNPIYMEGSSKVYQTVDMTVRLHVCWESYLDDDLDILNLTQEVYSALQFKCYGTWGAMKRRNEEQNFDHNNVQDFIQDYSVDKGKDFVSDRRPGTDATVNTLIINPSIVIEI